MGLLRLISAHGRLAQRATGLPIDPGANVYGLNGSRLRRRIGRCRLRPVVGRLRRLLRRIARGLPVTIGDVRGSIDSALLRLLLRVGRLLR